MLKCTTSGLATFPMLLLIMFSVLDDKGDCVFLRRFDWLGDVEEPPFNTCGAVPETWLECVSPCWNDRESLRLAGNREEFGGLLADATSECCIYQTPGPLEDMSDAAYSKSR